MIANFSTKELKVNIKVYMRSEIKKVLFFMCVGVPKKMIINKGTQIVMTEHISH